MSKKQLPDLQALKQVWNKYRDTLWVIEQNWAGTAHNYDERIALTNKALELIQIERKLQSLEKALAGREKHRNE